MKEYFNDDEFRCSCCGGYVLSVELRQMLNKAREIAGIPFVITSGYRCEKHNEYIGGVANSSHTKGVAVDISANDSRRRGLILKGLYLAGFTRVGISESFIHADIDNDKKNNVAWLY